MVATSTDAATLLAGDAAAAPLIQELFQRASNTQTAPKTAQTADEIRSAFAVGLHALNLFLQINVTGPVPSPQLLATIESQFLQAWESSSQTATSAAAAPLVQMRRECIRLLEVDGVSPYAHIPSLELFALAKHVLTKTLSSPSDDIVQLPETEAQRHSVAWTRLRAHVWHYKLIAQPSLSGSTFTKSANWIELPSLATQITESMDAVKSRVIGDDVWADDSAWSLQDKVQFLLEAANNYILLSRPDKAKELLAEATKTNHFLYALSGALGKRTKFQEKSTSQLVVLALSEAEKAATESKDDDEDDAKPQALQLNDDTLLEDIQFTKEKNGSEDKPSSDLPEKLAALSPDEQPQLNALDQITLLTEATIKDTFSPTDTLTAEEILPFAVRVLADKSTNWQTYTQALLVRSRIEVHRSRTIERGILQMQALADQVLTDTTFSPETSTEAPKADEATPDVPSIQVSAPGHHTGEEAAPAATGPTSFFPATKATESAPADVRLRYIHALSTPPRWHLEAELAYAWASAGSLASALEIFKRLRLWAEVALCYASAGAAEDDQGRGSGGEDKARGIIRWQLFHRTGADAASTSDPDDEVSAADVPIIKAADYSGPERAGAGAPANAPRLWCILGDLEDDAAHYERAWALSGGRYARAQRSLAEHRLKNQDLAGAHAAYKLATAANRLDPDMWSRLGDISLRLGRFEDAAEAYNRAISSSSGETGGEAAKTWSNLGTSLLSLYREVLANQKKEAEEGAAPPAAPAQPKADDEEDDVAAAAAQVESAAAAKNPDKLLTQALNAYKNGAAAAHDNWRIWENVVTLGCRMRPPAVVDIINATRQVLRIRQTEDAVNAVVLSALLQEEVLSKEKDPGADIYEPPRGTTERLITRVVEEDVVPLITRRGELWALVGKLRGWRRDYAGAVDAAEKAWRAAVGGGSSGGGLLPGDSTAAGGTADWTEDEAAWLEVVTRTDELVSVLENWGGDVPEIGQKWRGKARSAVRSVMGRGKTNWEGTEGWTMLEALMDGLKVSK